MNLVSWTLLLTSVLINIAAQLLLKAGARAIGEFSFSLDNILPIGLKLVFEPHILGGLTCYVASVVVWIMLLSRVEVSLAYPLMSLGYIGTALAAWLVFGENLSMERMLGIAVIMLGVYLLTRSA